MTLDGAIKYCLEVAKHNEMLIKRGYAGGCNSHDCSERAENHRQLAEWLRELKEAKRLLKLSLEQTNPHCKYCIHDLEEEQPNYNPCCTGETANCKWIYADEAEKLLKEDKE